VFRFAFEELALPIFTKLNERPDTGSMSLPGIFCERQDLAPRHRIGVALVDPLKLAVDLISSRLSENILVPICVRRFLDTIKTVYMIYFNISSKVFPEIATGIYALYKYIFPIKNHLFYSVFCEIFQYCIEIRIFPLRN
jgi:hypothetical protein